MVIGASNVMMSGLSRKNTSYTENRQVLMRNITTGERQYSQNSFVSVYSERAKNGKKTGNGSPLKEAGVNESDSINSLLDSLREYMYELRSRLQMMIGNRGYLDRYNNTLNLSSSPSSFSLWRRTEYTSYTYEEQEEMKFSTMGKAVTADGRVIEFNMELGMSREFVEQTESLNSSIVSIMTDPLVINLSDNPVSVSDQKWKFDIDADGEKDSISMLSEGSGYLVFDKNGDGIINDGSEMFGAKTGNGFDELAESDEDKNGWIDENDSIYNKLSVWVKDESGNDKLMSLKKANVGAIYLKSAATEFALKSMLNNEHNAQLRRTGVYLTEDGKARSVQQLDMVKALIS